MENKYSSYLAKQIREIAGEEAQNLGDKIKEYLEGCDKYYEEKNKPLSIEEELELYKIGIAFLGEKQKYDLFRLSLLKATINGGRTYILHSSETQAFKEVFSKAFVFGSNEDYKLGDKKIRFEYQYEQLYKDIEDELYSAVERIMGFAYSNIYKDDYTFSLEVNFSQIVTRVKGIDIIMKKYFCIENKYHYLITVNNEVYKIDKSKKDMWDRMNRWFDDALSKETEKQQKNKLNSLIELVESNNPIE